MKPGCTTRDAIRILFHAGFGFREIANMFNLVAKLGRLKPRHVENVYRIAINEKPRRR